MNANPAPCPGLFLVGGPTSRPDPVRARVALSDSIAEYGSGISASLAANHRGQHLPGTFFAERRRRGPHPWDVLYWVACLGGACLLLLISTT